MYGAADLPEDGSLPELTWAGARDIGRVVFIAPPNSGSVLSFENLVNGKQLGPPLAGFEFTKVFWSIYFAEKTSCDEDLREQVLEMCGT